MSATQLPRLPSESRRDRVANALRDAITRGQLRPGHRLIEMDVAAQLGTSRAPIREALRQLEQEGLVVSSPYRGTEVLGVSQDEIEQVLVPIRLTIERFAFERALPMLDENDLIFLQGLVDDMHIAADQENPERLADADVRFHEHVIIRSGQPHCLQMWRAIQPRVRAYFRRDAPVYGKQHALAAQHQELLDALRSRDPDAVRAAIEKHITTHQAFDE
ncbi:MAG: GntR family transcriptional regulator [Acidimicrobiia bacterium]|nr:GntR family transcriptional regulator [Acidimicrobiia bacterium]MBA3983232.1 GntR family transcriptional regulator [Acidimicrobiia bacterium]MDQ3391064.1 GntR family transcriptional regulator [Actinomycetota bacterium]